MIRCSERKLQQIVEDRIIETTRTDGKGTKRSSRIFYKQFIILFTSVQIVHGKFANTEVLILQCLTSPRRLETFVSMKKDKRNGANISFKCNERKQQLLVQTQSENEMLRKELVVSSVTYNFKVWKTTCIDSCEIKSLYTCFPFLLRWACFQFCCQSFRPVDFRDRLVVNTWTLGWGGRILFCVKRNQMLTIFWCPIRQESCLGRACRKVPCWSVPAPEGLPPLTQTNHCDENEKQIVFCSSLVIVRSKVSCTTRNTIYMDASLHVVSRKSSQLASYSGL